MKQWDVILYPFPLIGPHPAVVISPDDWCNNSSCSNVNALACTTLRQGAEARSTEVRLDQADGLDWATVVRCNQVYHLSKKLFGSPIGSISILRRRAIGRRIVDCFKLSL